MGDKNNFYVMDDSYIEEKYVRAEELRQKQEEERKAKQIIEERNALAEAERQRKAAEAERMRRQEEADRINALELAKKTREDLDRARHQKEAEYQSKLEKIELELNSLHERKGGFTDSKLQAAKLQSSEEEQLKEDLTLIQMEKQKILDREQDVLIKLESLQSKGKAKQMALDHEEQLAEEKIKSLTQERRNLQNEMLLFLKNPEAALKKPEPQPIPAPSFYAHQLPPQPQMPIQMQPPIPQPQPVPNEFYNQLPPTNNPVQSTEPKNDIKEQLGMLDDLLKQGVMNRDEYNANRREALKAAGYSEESYEAMNSGGPEVMAQIRQLDEYLRTGVLQRADYEDAKKRVLEDAKKSGQSSSNVTQVAVIVPAGKRPGDKIRISHLGRTYDVVIPPGVFSGQRFNASVPRS